MTHTGAARWRRPRDLRRSNAPQPFTPGVSVRHTQALQAGGALGASSAIVSTSTARCVCETHTGGRRLELSAFDSDSTSYDRCACVTHTGAAC